MSITVEISDELKKRMQENIALGDIQAARQLFLDAVFPAVEENLLAKHKTPHSSVDELYALLDELTDAFMQGVGPDCPVLSDYATSREGLYEEHL